MSLVAQVRPLTDGTELLSMWCPACDDLHQITIRGGGAWEWDGNLEAPTVSPSILVTGGASDRRCHSFLKAGVWQFLTDSTHALAGQTSPMAPLPDWLVREAAPEGEPS